MKKHDLYRFLISFVYPNVCPGCGEIIDYNDAFCKYCAKRLDLYEKEFQIPNVDLFFAHCLYQGIARDAVLEFKKDDCGNAYYAFAYVIHQKMKRVCKDKIDIVSYIPMFKDDFKKRGYNQSELIAKELHYMLEVPCEKLLKKCRKTRSQKSLNSEKRRENLKDAFEIDSKVTIEGKTIMLVDDVCTTGSTLSEAARVLKNAGAEKVIAAAFAKTTYQ